MEQGYQHSSYLFHLYELFKEYTFVSPYERLELRGPRKGKIKSYSFRTLVILLLLLYIIYLFLKVEKAFGPTL
jgi:hypothetical protein